MHPPYCVACKRPSWKCQAVIISVEGTKALVHLCPECKEKNEDE